MSSNIAEMAVATVAVSASAVSLGYGRAVWARCKWSATSAAVADSMATVTAVGERRVGVVGPPSDLRLMSTSPIASLPVAFQPSPLQPQCVNE
jgi:hypothetical protein